LTIFITDIIFVLQQPWCSKHQSMSGQQIMLDNK